jgi:spore germination protein KB
LGHLLPLFETPMNKIVLGGFAPISWLSEVSVILLLAPFLKQPSKVRKAAFFGVTITGLSLGWTILGTIAVFSAKLLPVYDYPTFSVFRIIEVANFIERIDVFFIAVWMGTMVMKLTIFMFAGFYCFCQTFRVQEKKFFLLPYGVLILSFSINAWSGSIDYITHQLYTVQSYLLFFNIAIPLLVYFTVFLKNRAKRVES